MAIILSSLLYARALQPFRPTLHPPFFSAVGSLDTDRRTIRTMDGRQCKDERESSRYVQTVPSPLFALISCITFPLGDVTHARVSRRYAQVLLSAKASVCPIAFFYSSLLVPALHRNLCQPNAIFSLCAFVNFQIPATDC